VALIAGPIDLGAIPALFGRPTVYARFLGTELQFVYGGRLLVVMPQGVALSQRGQLLHLSANDQRLRPGPSPDALAGAALTVIDQLVPASPAPRIAPKARSRGRPAREATSGFDPNDPYRYPGPD
jgi:hypothetical protein